MRKSRRIAIALFLALLMATMTGCSIVRIIPAGSESMYTGVKEFDASAEAAGDWAMIRSEIQEKAEDLNMLISNGTSVGTTYSVSFSGQVEEFNTDSPKGYLLVKVDGADFEVQVQVGKVYSGTTVRDSQTNKIYENFTNQTEWSAYAKTINQEVQNNVVEPLGELSELVGKDIEVVGCFASSGGTIVVTPVALTVK